MAGVTLLSLKRRLKTVTNTRKITKAMGLVSTSKYQKARSLLYSNEKHFKSLEEIVAEVFINIESKDSFYFGNKGVDKKLVIICNSDKGMVGSFNSAMINLSLVEMHTFSQVPYIITTGNRGMAVLKKLVMDDMHSEVLSLGDLPSFLDLEELFDHIHGLYKNGYVDEVIIYYTDYINAVKTEVKSERFLPVDESSFKAYINKDIVIDKDKEEKEKLKRTKDDDENKRAEDKKNEKAHLVHFEFSPSADEMQDELFMMYLKEKLYNIILKSKTSEQSVRMRAMESATKNADEILLSLNKQFNRLRQSVITQEISEIVGGAEALK